MVESVPNGIITFPMFGEGFSLNPPSSFRLWASGPEIYWYGVIIAVGFVLAYLYVDYYRKKVGLSANDYLDFLLWAVPSGIVGARIYYVIFNFSQFQDNLWGIFNTRAGGLAIYGGVIGAAIAIILVARHKKIPAAAILDCAAPGLLIGQTVGRWGNFMNREVFGFETDIFCRMGLTDAAGKTIYVHPTFLYESIWNLIGLLLIHFFTKHGKRKYDGQVFAIYIAWYGLGRAFIEGIRTDTLKLFGTSLKVSQVLAVLTFIIAAAFLAYNGSKEHPPEKLYVNRPQASGDDKTAVESED